MAKQPSTAVAPRRTTEVALPKELMDELAQSAKDEAAIEAPAAANFSLRAGVLSFDGNPIPGNTMDVIVLASAFERAFYDRDFDPDNPRSPVCFAINEDGDDMKPHENSLTKKNATCDGCPLDEWGTDPKGGRGKACKEVRRLCLLPSNQLDNPEKATLANLRVPVTSVKNWGNYVHLLAATVKRPPWSVITTITVKPNVKTQFQVEFEPANSINSVELLARLKPLRDKAFKLVTLPYSMAEDLPPDPESTPKGRGGKKKY